MGELPYVEPTQSVISVEQKTGEIEGFNFHKLANSLKQVGVTDEQASKIVTKVKAKLCKLDPPVATQLIKAAVV